MKFNRKSLALMLIDAVLVNLAAFGSFYLRFEGNIPQEYFLTYYHTAWAGTLIYLVIFSLFGLYNRLWQYASISELLSIVYAVTVGTSSVILVIYFLAPMRYPNTVAVLLWLTTTFLIGGSRFLGRILQDSVFNLHFSGMPKRVLIIGAGDAGALAVRELKNSNYREGYPVGIIDDAPQKQKLKLMGIPVLGTREDITRVMRSHKVEEVIIAMPSAPGDVIRDINEICEKSGLVIKIIPGIYNYLSGEMDSLKIREVQIEDLLGRDQVNLDIEEVAGYLAGETVLITGAGGSIGSELCRQICRFNPQKLILAGRGENSIFDIEQELRSECPGVKVVTEILDVKDIEKVGLVFRRYKPGVVFHAAAHKHVPLMERNPEEALKNNILGTYNVAEISDVTQVKTFVLISTDKAINPTSIMGATKRVAEMIIQSLDRQSQTRFVAVRFGNVLGSRGSVIPTFKKQINKGGPVTVTHPEMVRYFMTIPEAAQLVIQAGAMARGGEVFILDMGKPVKIVDLARDLIRLSGFEVDVDIKIEYTGIRPGEKLYEELLTAEEGAASTKHQRIFVAKPNGIDVAGIEGLVQMIRERGSYLTREEIVKELGEVVPGFKQLPGKREIGRVFK
ncbi:polysaccharide biosynthesis protein [Desulfosporosinus lacus]|uniref:NDP-sugar epimerase, includes UDP-GlcNAc-inverting 4,6-dehydratase FlaA1 and capsular polysaccharide biosynthesis protein EpsC n=1 Tax=Desulfosporosinus lacus DSM 15449 TaxID=1121420 RepID=A0A1M5ZIX9_9FIRM|nr:nucleoside-diphosphate sugar epimerase/dehydratase [Desulfosporosinus lacus]SHI24190.1 NDP-sugar epimerase, includes UDP-GlcNAc-inverting 4,6-dehydratase FlaA1 and capsular polysaccharide biosynthesis protein EpsC [Desulfosporosinus lacus DSM 15449]